MPQKISVSLKRKRSKGKKIFFRFFLVFLSCFIFFAIALGVLFSLDSLKIKKISILGAQSISLSQIKAEVENFLNEKFLGIVPKNRIFYFPKKRITAALLSDFPQIETVKIEDNLSSLLTVSIKERKPVALLCQAEDRKCFYLDKNGFVFSLAPYFSSGVFIKVLSDEKDVYNIGSFVCQKDVFKKIMSFQKRLDSLLPISEIHLKKDNLVEFYTRAGPYLILDVRNNQDEVYKNFSVFYDKFLKNQSLAKIEYIDLRFGNKIYYK